MKKGLTLLVTLTFLLTTIIGTAFAAVPMETVITTSAGEMIEVPIILENSENGITAAVLDIEYDTDTFELINVSDTELLEGATFLTSALTSPSFFRSIWQIGIANSKESGTILLLTFRVKETATDGEYNLALSYEQNNVYNTALENENVQFKAPSIIVEAIPAETIPPEILTNMKGDLDKDGNISLDDAQCVLKIALGIIEITEADEYRIADLDGDDTVTLEDAQLILKSALGIGLD